MNVACILLAAGFSARFGENKLLYPVDGRPMAEYAIALHAEIPYVQRILVTQQGYAPLARLAENGGYTTVLNPDPARGLSSSISCGLEALLGPGFPPDGVLFAVADQPRLLLSSVRELLALFLRHPDRIVALAANGRRGNPVVFPAAFYRELLTLNGEEGGATILRRRPDAVLLCDVARPEELADIDTKLPV